MLCVARLRAYLSESQVVSSKKRAMPEAPGVRWPPPESAAEFCQLPAQEHLKGK